MPASRRCRSSAADVLAIAAHRDDVEQTCGGTLLRMAARGLRTAILDLTQGEAGTRGTAEDRAREAAEAARICWAWAGARRSTCPTARSKTRSKIASKIVRVLRQLRPRVVILPYWQARHPDHAIVATLGYEACFLSGLAKIETGAAPHRPFKIVYASLYADVRPSFIVDITPFIEQRHAALMAYQSQYANQAAGSGLVCAGRRDSRAHLCRGAALWAAGRRELWRAVCAERSRPGGRSDAAAGAIDLNAFELQTLEPITICLSRIQNRITLRYACVFARNWMWRSADDADLGSAGLRAEWRICARPGRRSAGVAGRADRANAFSTWAAAMGN